MSKIQEENQNFYLEHLNEPFNIQSYLQHDELKARTLEPGLIEKRNISMFHELCDRIKVALQDVINIDENLEKHSNSEWLDRQHNAVIGHEPSVQYFIEEIQKVLRDRNITFKDYPRHYGSLGEAIFHEVWGLSVLSKWENYPDSEAALIEDINLWIDFGDGLELQEERFSSIDTVKRVKRAFINRRKDSVVKDGMLEIEREDGSRITIVQPPTSREEYIMFRRFTIDTFTLEEQMTRETIPIEDIPIYKALARTLPNMIIAGPVRSAKSTFLKTLVGERPKRLVHAVLEKAFELAFAKHFPGRLFYELRAKEGDLEKVFPTLLRMEHNSVIIGEIRSIEIEAFLEATERGERGALSTYHLTDVTRVVRQLTNHVLDVFPTRKYDVELERVATALDIIITMGTDHDRARKRVTGVAEVIWDDKTNTHHVQELIKYSELTKKYYYHNKISNRLLLLMAKQDIQETKTLIKTLKARHKISPLEDLKDYEGDFLSTLLGTGD
jgi:pilus assembly protein CpaF